ncbi:MAG: YcxB family protein [Lachnospiraceae bacterium]
MSIEFDVKLEVKDMFWFNMYHTYTGFHGIFSILLAVVSFVYCYATFGKVGIGYTIAYAAFGVVVLVYIPLSLYTNSKRQIAMSEVMQQGLHYQVDKKGITVTSGEESAELPWNQIYKIVETKHGILVYSTRRNAYVIPQTAVDKQHDPLVQLMKENMEKYRIRFKKLEA